jgi:hypothetical protein
VIAIPNGLRVLIATRPVDFRKGMDGLAAVVKEHLRADPFSGAIFVFRAKRADRVKLIVWDGTGLFCAASPTIRLPASISCSLALEKPRRSSRRVIVTAPRSSADAYDCSPRL